MEHDLFNKYWKKKESLYLEMELEDFSSVVDFVNDIRVEAEESGHHPNIKIYEYNKIRVELFTHDKGVLTDKDYELASKISNLIKERV